MSRTMWLAALVLFVASPALAQDAVRPGNLAEENQKKIDEARRLAEERMAQYGWAAMATRLPGGYAFLDRLDVTADQRKVLGEIYKEWQAKESEAWKKISKELPPLPPEDWKDAEKRQAYEKKTKELREKHKVEPPVDQVMAVLTVEQMDVLAAANQAVTEWTKWVQTALPEFERRLTEAVGPMPEKPDDVTFWYTQLEKYLKGSSQMVRLGLPDAARQEVRKLATAGNVPTPAEWWKATWEMGKLQRVPAVHTQSLDEALQAGRAAQNNERVRGELNKLLTNEQVQKLAKGAEIAEERDKAIVEHYRACVAKVTKALPGRQSAPGARFGHAGPQPQGVTDAVQAWNKWLETELPKYERRIDELLGPEPKNATTGELWEYSRLAMYYVRGARLLGRLGLSDDQKTALKKIGAGRTGGDHYEAFAMSGNLVRASDVTRGYEPMINGAITAADQRPADAASPEEFLKGVLTPDQYAKLAAARLILDERDKAVWERYVQTVTAVQKALPAATPPKDVAPVLDKPKDAEPRVERRTGPPGSMYDPDPFGRPSVIAPLSGDGAIDQALRRLSLSAEQKAKLAPIVDAAEAQRKADYKAQVEAKAPLWKKSSERQRQLIADGLTVEEQRNDAEMKAWAAAVAKVDKDASDLVERRRREVAEKILPVLTPDQAKLFREWEIETAQTVQGEAWRTAQNMLNNFAPTELNLPQDQKRQILELLRRRTEQSYTVHQKERERMAALVERLRASYIDADARAEMDDLSKKNSTDYAAEMKATREEVEKLLTPEQRTQFHQILKERIENAAKMWTGSAVQVLTYRNLNLSAEQKQKIDALADNARKALTLGDAGFIDVARTQRYRDAAGQLQKDIDALLTDEQKAKLKEPPTPPRKPQP